MNLRKFFKSAAFALFAALCATLFAPEAFLAQAAADEPVVVSPEVTVTPASVNLYADGTAQTAQLAAKSEASGDVVTWSSGNPGIATVDQNGLVTAKSVGTTTVYADGSYGGRGSCSVRVYNASGVNFYVSPSALSLSPDFGAPIAASAYPPEDIEWSSDNASVATVDSRGIVNATGYGTAVITAKGKSSGKYGSCWVYVTDGSDAGIPALTQISATAVDASSNPAGDSVAAGAEVVTSAFFEATDAQKAVVAQRTGLSAADLVANGDGKLTLSPETANEKLESWYNGVFRIKNGAVQPDNGGEMAGGRINISGGGGDDVINIGVLPIADAAASASGNTAVFGFEITGGTLGVVEGQTLLRDIQALKVTKTGYEELEMDVSDVSEIKIPFRLAAQDEPQEFEFEGGPREEYDRGSVENGSVALYSKSAAGTYEKLTANSLLGKNETYILNVAVKDGGTLDWDATQGKIIDPIVLVTKQSQNASGGDGGNCNVAGLRAAALFALAPLAILLKRKK